MASEPSPRTRRLTSKAQAEFEEKVRQKSKRLRTQRESINSLLQVLQTEEDLDFRAITKEELRSTLRKYEIEYSVFQSYLERVGTQESKAELSSLQLINNVFKNKIKIVCNIEFDLDTIVVDEDKQTGSKSVHEARTNKSSSLRSSKPTLSNKASTCRSKRTSIMLAEAEAIRAKSKFAEKELQLKRECAELEEEEAILKAKANRNKANLQAELEMLDQQKQVAAAEAKIGVLLSDQELRSDRQSSASSYRNIRIKNSIQDQNEMIRSGMPETTTPVENRDKAVLLKGDINLPATSNTVPQPMVGTPSLPHNQSTHTANEQVSITCTVPQSAVPVTISNTQLKVSSAPFVPIMSHTISAPTPDATPLWNVAPMDNYNPAEAFTKYLLKKDLIMARFSSFNDDPATYPVWKNSFLTIVRELQANAQEETDLLVKWLGHDSSKQVVSLRTSNSHNPSGGLLKIWSRLDERYGAPELIDNTLRQKISRFPRITPKEYQKLYDLLDILSEIESMKEDPRYRTLLSYYDSSAGINPVIAKLPHHMQNKWTERATRYKHTHNVTFPPFSQFVSFISELSSMMNDPSFTYTEEVPRSQKDNVHIRVQTRKTFINPKEATENRERIPASSTPVEKGCIIHAFSQSHTLNDCRLFKRKSLTERKNILKENRMCYRCCEGNHNARDCKAIIKCTECGSCKHPSGLHETRFATFDSNETRYPRSNTNQGGESSNVKQISETINVKHTTVCGMENVTHISPENDEEMVNVNCSSVCNGFSGRSCAKIILVRVFPDNHPERGFDVYAILDDQSNRTLASTYLLDALNVAGEEVRYTLSSCSGSFTVCGRKACGYTIQSIDGTYQRQLPTMLECDDIPNDKSEIATPEIIRYFDHLRGIPIFPFRPECQIGLLIGRDLPDIHHVKEQVTGPMNSPFAQRLGLGWVVVGEVCLEKVHKPRVRESGIILKTSILLNGRGTIFDPCQNKLLVKEEEMPNTTDVLFKRKKDDVKVGTSVEDREFLIIMDKETFRNDEGNWTAPLPFRQPHEKMPNNRHMALKRALMLDTNLKKNPTKKEHFVSFMSKVLNSGAAEVAPSPKGEVWYLPIFGVYQQQKPDQIRGVFDSAAIFEGVSLNKCLLSGPNLTNDLLGILLRFRKDQFAIAADIEQMFYSFLVKEDQRDFLRFFWYKENNPDLGLIEYRMKAHVFGNSPSPAIATYGLRKSVEGDDVDDDVRNLVNRNFYVDDALTSLPKEEDAVSLLQRTQTALKKGGNLRLHKFVSNSPKVMSAFPVEDLGKEVKSLQLDKDSLPTHRSLGLLWDMNSDKFKFDTCVKGTPQTRRGMLSALNSIYDPLGFAAPITIQGKIVMRKINKGYSWDDTLDPTVIDSWKAFEESMVSLKNLSISRMILPSSLSTVNNPELLVFSDASEQAVRAVAYMESQTDGKQHIGFVMGKAKIAPSHGHTVPRLELCAALLATDVAQIIIDNLDIELKTVRFYTDSKVVLGYLNNRTRRFYNYVANRVERILKVTNPDQWNYVSTKDNPADHGTRGLCTANDVQEKWLKGPERLQKVHGSGEQEEFPLISPEEDKEIRVNVSKTKVNVSLVHRFERYSDWFRLISALSLLKTAVKKYSTRSSNVNTITAADIRLETERFVLGQCQLDQYPEEMNYLRNGQHVQASSAISTLAPILDSTGVMRVGGRLSQGCLPVEEINPIILSGKSHVAKLLVRHYHEKIKHQGRLLTEGTLRNHGFWIVGGKRLISSVIHQCVMCRKLRGSVQSQKMADLPVDRLIPGPPFTSVGIDTFGPWNIVTRKTRGGVANSKRWAIMFTCLTTRAVHIECVEEMSSSSFINALIRFIAIRGNVKELRSDRGTNFVGAAHVFRSTDKLEIINVENGPITSFLKRSEIVWIFNPPHSSHMGGVWERMIGLTRRILDAMFLEVSTRNLTHEVLVTFMAEVCAIINSRPLAPISTDPESPMIMSPATLLTQKTGGGSLLSGSLDIKDIYKEQWKRTQVLADMFWKKWREGYLQTLQTRRKWKTDTRDVKNGDVILLKDKCLPRREWAVGVVVNAVKSGSDGKVRKAEVRVAKEGSIVTYTRPITEMVILVEN